MSTSGTGPGGCFAILKLAMAAASTVATAGSSLLLRRLLAPGLLFLVKLSSGTGRLRRLDIIRAKALPVANATSTAALGGERMRVDTSLPRETQSIVHKSDQ
jgi:hypothetical protein